MAKPQYHILVCNSYRVSGEPQGVCNKKGAINLLQYIEQEVIERGLDVLVSSTGCLKVCGKGPVMVVYPNAWWYGELNEDKIDDILQCLEQDKPREEYLIY